MKYVFSILLLTVMACAPQTSRVPTCEELKETQDVICDSDVKLELQTRLASLREDLEVQVRVLQSAVEREEENKEAILNVLAESHRDKDVAYSMLKLYSENIAQLFATVSDITRQINEISDYLGVVYGK